ncbi:hypothetical protein ACOI1H_17650 [Loktanella sp. DJP18]|uniref:hypothetical protein n=1 Tax=Loktanella sp. DJP18 TaxID=3409788 RepID=UPI003BB5521F
MMTLYQANASLQTSQNQGSSRSAHVKSCRELIAGLDRMDGPLGPRSSWPHELNVMIALILRAEQSMNILWGKDCILLYNDAYIPTLAENHPYEMGRKLSEVFPEIWVDRVEPMVRKAFSGSGFYIDEMDFVLQQGGRSKEANYAVSFTPIEGADGEIAGILSVNTERTKGAIEKARTELLEDITSTLLSRQSLDRKIQTSCRLIAESLACNMVVFGSLNVSDGTITTLGGWHAVDVAPLDSSKTYIQLYDVQVSDLQNGKNLTISTQSRRAIDDGPHANRLLICPIFEGKSMTVVVMASDSSNTSWLESHALLLSRGGNRIADLIKICEGNNASDEERDLTTLLLPVQE